jgi:hypothetical protein
MTDRSSQNPENKPFGAFRRKTVRLTANDLVKTSVLNPDQGLPVVVEPKVEHLDLVGWIGNHKEFSETLLFKHGGILSAILK